MATRRMFSQDVVASDYFLDMPLSCQVLYFHLGMYADDDGFVSPQKIIRMIGANADDLKILLSKGFLLQFESKVIVIRHWKQNNLIKSDRYRPTQYTHDFNKLNCMGGVYSLEPSWNQNGTKTEPQVRLGREVGREVIEAQSLKEIKKKAFNLKS